MKDDLQKGNAMIDQEEDNLRKVLESNPFLPELDKWESDLGAFREGRMKLDELHFVLKSDMDNFNWYQQNVACRTEDTDTFLHPEVFPQPFIGDPRAPIWYLLLNPGYGFPDRYDHLGICSFCERRLSTEQTIENDCVFDKGRDKLANLKKRQELLLRQLRLESGMPFYLLDDAFDTLKGSLARGKDGGYRWWRTILFGANRSNGFLLPECGVRQHPASVSQKIFVLECAPYHSRNFDGKVLWAGSKYTEFWVKLISWAVETGRKFIVRSEKVVDVLTKNDLQVNEINSLRFSSNQNVSLTMRNLRGQATVFDAVRKALSDN